VGATRLRIAKGFGDNLNNQPELSIVIPCLNEEENIETILTQLSGILSPTKIAVETLVLDDQSDDDTFMIAQKSISRFQDLNIRVIRRYQPRRGYGAIVRYGMAHGTGKYCIFVAADGVDPIELIPSFLERMRAGADLVQCSRYLNPADDKTIPFKYKFYQVIFRFLLRLLLGENIRDSTYAFKMFNRIELMALGLSQNRFSISPEITFKVLLSGGKIEYVAAGQGTRVKGESKFVFRREGRGYAYVLFRAWLHRIGILWF
jgi:glycosyltransferase involved in cell wall biosynthesis